MIGKLTGRLDTVSDNSAIIDVAGVLDISCLRQIEHLTNSVALERL